MLSSPLMCAPVGPWSNAIEIIPGARYIFTAGLVGDKPDGTFDTDIFSQTEQTFRNLVSILHAGGMNLDHVVKLSVYLSDLANQPRYAEARSAALGNRRPAMSLFEVASLAAPALLIEIEAIAAKHD